MTSPGPMHINIRAMLPSDNPAVEELDRVSFHDPWPKGAFLYELRPNSNSIVLVAEALPLGAQPQIVGVTVGWLIVDEVHVATLSIAPAQRGLGIGRRLLAQTLLLAAEQGAQKSLLEVRISNEEALHLYYGFGYKAVGLRPGYYQDNHEDALLLTLSPLDKQRLCMLAAENPQKAPKVE